VGGDVEFFTVGPRFFPYLTAAIMGVLALVLILQSALEVRAGAPPPRLTLTGAQLRPVLVFIVVGIAYSAALPFLGVPIATPICLVVCFRYFGLRNWGLILLLAAGTTAVIYLSFEKIMMVPLPMGFLET
jgi:putative tricarboxylic transport membrane protein